MRTIKTLGFEARLGIVRMHSEVEYTEDGTYEAAFSKIERV